jgi:hypothetical protein
MRSTTSSHRRLHPGATAPARRLDAIAQLVDEATSEAPHHVAVQVTDDGDDILLGTLPLPEGSHPFAELAGFTAPPDWSMFGLCVRGTAHHLDGAHPPVRTATTFLVDRHGRDTSVLRTPDGTRALTGPASGTLPDLCRRVLGLPTAPAPHSTAQLWIVAWLDRVIEAWGDPDRRRLLTASWTQVAVLHPAVRCAPDADLLSLDDPARLVAVAQAHTVAWPWARLRAEPHGLVLPDGHLPTSITTWMDDGFYARWALGAYPPPDTLASDLIGVLDPPLRQPFLETLTGLLA